MADAPGRPPRKLDRPQDRGAFFRSLGTLMAGFVAERMEEAVTASVPILLRPPGALDELAFLTACTRCDKCREACPQDAVRKAGPSAGLALGTPFVDPREMPCFLCTELPCVTACPEGALVWPRVAFADGEVQGPRAVRMGLARVRERLCLAFPTGDREATACTTCVDRCPYPGGALRLAVPEGGGPARPVVNPDLCTGCGLCVFGCPTREPAIVVDPRPSS